MYFNVSQQITQKFLANTHKTLPAALYPGLVCSHLVTLLPFDMTCV